MLKQIFSLLDGNSKFDMLPKPDLDKLDQGQNNQMKTTLSLNKVSQVLSTSGNKLPSVNLDYRLYCSDPTAELHPATLRCYSQCPQGYNKYGVSCFSNCALPQKDEFSTYCIEPEMRKPIELYGGVNLVKIEFFDNFKTKKFKNLLPFILCRGLQRK